jgi:RHS repeat-associated protein
VYDLDRFKRCGEPAFASTLARETHVSDPLPAQGLQIQLSFTYSDGYGRELQSKIRAEAGDAAQRGPNVTLPGGDIQPGPLTHATGSVDPRWVGKGRTIYNNKGKPVKQYEPFFSSTHLYEPEPEMTETGVTGILFYDPLTRVAATLHPNHTYEKVVFDPWQQETWDVNDTITQSDPKLDPDVGDFFKLLPLADYSPTWFDQRRNGQKGPDEKSAADKAAAHAGTPTVVYFDTLGRTMLTVADNGLASGGIAQKFATRMTLDIEGNQREVIDAKNRVVMRYDYDMLGNRISQASMEAGQRWMLNDATGKPLRSWDSRAHNFRIEYDELRRAVHSFVVGSDPAQPDLETCVEISVYGESSASGLTPAQVQQANLRGKIYKDYGTAGVTTSERYDFKGNPLRSTQQLAQDYKTPPDWSKSPALETESFVSTTSFDALNRPIQLVAPHSNQAGARINVLQPGYNEANLLERMDAWLGQTTEPSGLLDPTSANLHAVTNLDYNAKGQRTRVDYGNGASTEYFYDEQTFRLAHLKTTGTSTASPGFLGRLLGRAGAPTSSVLQDLFYTYDPAGNITHIRDDAQQTIYFSGQVVPPECDYSYDPIYRLTRATGREHIGQLAQPQTSWDDQFRTNLPQPGDGTAMRNYTEQYLYDAVGNFDRLVHQATNGNWTRTYSYNEASLLESAKKSNRLSSTSVGAATDAYSHDAHGNMTTMPHLTLMQWDFRDQLSATSRQAVNPTPPPANVAQTTLYVYDSRGERVRKVTESQAGVRREERIYLGGFELYRKFAADGVTSNLERETLHVMDDKQRVALVESRTQGNDGSPAQLVRYQFGNHLGSASLELDDKGIVISYEEYYPYGSTSYEAVDMTIKAAAKRYRYTGKERDEENGLEYCGARYYAPWLGRWVAADPSGLIAGVNRFSYCHSRPLVLLDPDGKQPTGLQPGPVGPNPYTPPPTIYNPPPTPPTTPVSPSTPVSPTPVSPSTPVSPPVTPRAPVGGLRILGIGAGPLLAGIAVFLLITLVPINKAHTNEYTDPDTGQKHVFHTYEARDAYLRQKEAEKRIAPGAASPSSEVHTPGGQPPGEERKDPAPSKGDANLPGAPGPDHVQAPGKKDPKGDAVVAATPNKAPLRYKIGPNDLDWRGTGKSFNDALNEAFRRTGVPKEDFEITKWGKDEHGKSFPVEWRDKTGAEVNIDAPHAGHGPDAPHVGWQTGGKRGSGGGQRGHIIIDQVPRNR